MSGYLALAGYPNILIWLPSFCYVPRWVVAGCCCCCCCCYISYTDSIIRGSSEPLSNTYWCHTDFLRSLLKLTVTELLDRHSVTSKFWILDLPPKLICQPLSVEFHTGCWPSWTPKHSCCSLPLVCSPAMFRMLESKWIYRTWILNSVSLLAHDLVKQGWETERPSWEFTAAIWN